MFKPRSLSPPRPGLGAALLIASILLAVPAAARAQDSPDGLWTTALTIAAQPQPPVFLLNRAVLERVLAGIPAEGALRPC